MSAPDTFLSRWSRRKREAATPAKVEPDLPETPEAPLASDRGAAEDAPATIQSAGDGALTEEELAALPSLDDLTAATDLAPFMRNGVPGLLRNAALRRMWSLDPAIRDFVGEARDYSYDWNVPGGVPVSGPLMPGDDAEATLSRMFSRLSSDGPSDDVAASEGSETEAHSERDAEPAEHIPAPAPDGVGDEQADMPALSNQEESLDARRTENPAVAALPEPGSNRKRHGGALPKLDLF